MKQQRKGGFLIAKIHQLGGRIFARILREHGIEINPSQGRIMFVLWRYDDIPIGELARRTSLEKSTLTSMLDRLEKRGYIKRVQSSKDRRKIIIQRTQKDRDLEGLYVQVSQKMTELFYKDFSLEEIKRFEGYLERILHNLESR